VTKSLTRSAGSISRSAGFREFRFPAEIDFAAANGCAREHTREGVVLLAQPLEQRIRKASGPATVELRKLNQPFRFLNRHHTEHHRVDQTEDRHVRAYAECQGQDGNGGEHRAAPQSARGVADVLKEFLDPADTTSVAAFLFHMIGSTKLNASAAFRFLLRHARRQVFLDLHREVKLQFLIKLALDAGSTDERAQS
jgi:hypothetical protein